MASDQPTRHAHNFKDLTGQRFGRWKVIGRSSRSSRGKCRHWVCRCDCGAIRDVDGATLRNKATVSCGCYSRERTGDVRRTHGLSHTSEHDIWLGIQQRCGNPSHPQHADYGGRGISVSSRWLGPTGFANFLADMGPRPSDHHSIDRINNHGPYSPDNCRWATAGQQARNTRRNRLFTHDGVTLCLTDWARRLGVNIGTVRSRLYRGLDECAALGLPHPKAAATV